MFALGPNEVVQEPVTNSEARDFDGLGQYRSRRDVDANKFYIVEIPSHIKILASKSNPPAISVAGSYHAFSWPEWVSTRVESGCLHLEWVCIAYWISTLGGCIISRGAVPIPSHWRYLVVLPLSMQRHENPEAMAFQWSPLEKVRTEGLHWHPIVVLYIVQ